jgi:hypothetical protein
MARVPDYRDGQDEPAMTMGEHPLPRVFPVDFAQVLFSGNFSENPALGAL